MHFLEPSPPLRLPQNGAIAGRKEISVLGATRRRLINDNWGCAVAGHIRKGSCAAYEAFRAHSSLRRREAYGLGSFGIVLMAQPGLDHLRKANTVRDLCRDGW